MQQLFSKILNYLYLNLKNSITKTKINVMLFAKIRGKSLKRNPYIIHKNIPTPKITNISKDISLVSFNFHILITCGMNEMVVMVAATKPITVVIFITLT